jgi:hypothetical protein
MHHLRLEVPRVLKDWGEVPPRLAGALAEQLGGRVGGRGVGLVTPALAMKVAAAIAADVVRPPASSLGRKLFIEPHAWISVPSTLKCVNAERSFFKSAKVNFPT